MFRLLFRSVKGKHPVAQTFVKQNRKRGIYKLIISLLEIGESTAKTEGRVKKTKSFAFHNNLPSMHFCLFWLQLLYFDRYKVAFRVGNVDASMINIK